MGLQNHPHARLEGDLDFEATPYWKSLKVPVLAKLLCSVLKQASWNRGRESYRKRERQKSGEVFLKQLHFQNEDVPCLSAPEHVSLCNYSQAILLLYQPKDSHQTRTHPRPVSHKQFSSLSELMENVIYKKESTSCIQDISK